MNKIVFDVKLVKENDVDVVRISAKHEHSNHAVMCFFNPPASKEELVVDLTATLNSLMSALDKG